MTKRKILATLNAKLIAVIILAAAVGLGIYFGGNAIADWGINTFYFEDEAVYGRSVKVKDQLQDYLDENQISSKDINAIANWTIREKYVYIVVYKGDLSPSIEAGAWGAEALEDYDYPWFNELEEDESAFFNVKFADGSYRVGVFEYSEEKLHLLFNIVFLFTACVASVIIILLYNRYVIKAIVRISKDTREIKQGNLQRQITVKGNDELAMLAEDVNAMRDSIIQKMQKEQEAWQANSELITSISHDLRTPLTALIGYLDLAKEKQYDNNEELEHYIDISLSKAMQLKKLTDELFEYFLVFEKQDIELNIEIFDGSLIIEQILGEQIIKLRSEGYVIKQKDTTGDYHLRVDVLYLKRVFDNLFSNIEKHADKTREVSVEITISQGQLRISVANYIPNSPRRVESTKIGLKTCTKIISQMGGSFTTSKDEEQFIAEVILPVE